MKSKKNTQHDYAFDARLHVVVRVTAKDEVQARIVLDKALDSADINYQEGPIAITEASLWTSAEENREPHLFEVDGEPVN